MSVLLIPFAVLMWVSFADIDEKNGLPLAILIAWLWMFWALGVTL